MGGKDNGIELYYVTFSYYGLAPEIWRRALDTSKRMQTVTKVCNTLEEAEQFAQDPELHKDYEQFEVKSIKRIELHTSDRMQKTFKSNEKSIIKRK